MSASSAHAQGTLRVIGSDVRNAVGDALVVWSSPAHASSSDWVGVGASMATFLIVTPADDDVDRYFREHPRAVVSRLAGAVSDTGSVSLIKGGAAHRLLQGSGVLYLAGLVSGKSALRDAGLGCATAVETNLLPRITLYEVVARRRPRAAAGDQYRIDVPGGEWDDHSFFGGHVANAMACASFLNERFDLSVAGPLLYLAAAGVGVGRMYDQQHWTSDTVLGAIYGYAVGRAVARRSKARREERDAAPTRPIESSRRGHLEAWHANGQLRFGWRSTF